MSSTIGAALSTRHDLLEATLDAAHGVCAALEGEPADVALVFGASVRLHARDASSADDDLRRAPRVRALPGSDPAGAIVFSCNRGRSAMFGACDHDAAMVQRELGFGPGSSDRRSTRSLRARRVPQDPGQISWTSGKYVLARAGSRVRSARPEAAACAPMKKSGNGMVLPPARRYAASASATSHALAHGDAKRLIPAACSARSSPLRGEPDRDLRVDDLVDRYLAGVERARQVLL